MSAFPNMIAYEVSREAVVLYAFMLSACSADGICEGVYGIGGEAALHIEETKAAIRELEDKGFIATFLEDVPIAEISGGIVWGSSLSSVLLKFDKPLTHQRLSAEAWNRIRKMVFERDDYTCCYCGERGKKLECDHIEPISRGGTNELGNLVTACFKCNRAKRAKMIGDWRAQS